MVRKASAVVLLAAAVLAAGGLTAAPVPQAGRGKLVVQKRHRLVEIDPDTGAETELVRGTHFNSPAGAVSPDGKRLVFAERTPVPVSGDYVTGFMITLRRLDGSGPDVPVDGVSADARQLRFDWAPDGSRLRVSQEIDQARAAKLPPAKVPPPDVLVDATTGRGEPLALPAQPVRWKNMPAGLAPTVSPTALGWFGDGNTLLVAHMDLDADPPGLAYQFYDVATKRLTPLALPKGRMVLDWTRDGKTLLTLGGEAGKGELCLVPRGGGKPRPLPADAPCAPAKLSPDGTRVAFSRGGQTVAGRELHVVAVAGGAPVKVAEAPALIEFAWSPDGKRLAYGWQHRVRKGNEGTETAGFLGVCDADGSNRRTLLSEKVGPSKEALEYDLWPLGWR